MTKIKLPPGKGLALFGGLLLGIGQSVPGASLLAFIAWVPLLLCVKSDRKSVSLRRRLMYLTLFLGTAQCVGSYWLLDFGTGTGVAIQLINILPAILLLLPFVVAVHRRLPEPVPVLLLVTGWITFELFNEYAQIGFPLFTPGVSLAEYPTLVSWYAWTGASLGSVWVLTTNYLIYRILIVKPVPALGWLTVLLPGLLGVVVKASLNDASAQLQIAAFHPEVDNRDTEGRLNATGAANLAAQHFAGLPATTDLLLLPENYLPDAGWVTTIEEGTEAIAPLDSLMRNRPHTTLLTGALVYDPVPTAEQTDPLSNFSSVIQDFFYAYSAIVAVTSADRRVVRTKQLLVPFEETLPYTNLLGRALGGLRNQVTGGGYLLSTRTDTDPIILTDKAAVLSSICYEMLFPRRMAALLRDRRVGLLTAHLNENWYDRTTGAYFFQRHARCRALELGRSVARSSNRGITDLILPNGDLLAARSARSAGPTTVSGSLPVVHTDTLYTRLVSRLLPWLVLPVYILLILRLYWR